MTPIAERSELDALDKRIIALRQAGNSMKAIAKILHIRDSTVSQRIAALGMSKRAGPEITWTEPRNDELIRLRSENCSFSICADILGTTRSAVAGQCYRLGLSTPRDGVPPHKRPKPRPKAVRTTPSPRQEAAMCCPQYVPLTVRFADHDERKQCCWPVGEPDGFDTQYCAHGQIEGADYCAYHYRMKWRASAPKLGVVRPFRRERAA